MNATQRLHDLGQSLWLDNIPRVLLSSGTLGRYISDYAVTGLTSNPTIFEQAIGKSDSYDAAIRDTAQAGKSGETPYLRGQASPSRRSRPSCSRTADARSPNPGAACSIVSSRRAPLSCSRAREEGGHDGGSATRSVVHRYAAHAFYRCGAKGGVRPSWHTDGRGADGVLPVAAFPALRPG